MLQKKSPRAGQAPSSPGRPVALLWLATSRHDLIGKKHPFLLWTRRSTSGFFQAWDLSRELLGPASLPWKEKQASSGSQQRLLTRACSRRAAGHRHLCLAGSQRQAEGQDSLMVGRGCCEETEWAKLGQLPRRGHLLGECIWLSPVGPK